MAQTSLQTYITFPAGTAPPTEPTIESVPLPNGLRAPSEGLTGLSETTRLARAASLLIRGLHEQGLKAAPVSVNIAQGVSNASAQRVSLDNIKDVRGISLRHLKGHIVDIIHSRFNEILEEHGEPREDVFAGGAIFTTTRPDLVAKLFLREPMFSHIVMVRYEALDAVTGQAYSLTTILDTDIIEGVRCLVPGMNPHIAPWHRPAANAAAPTSARSDWRRRGFRRAGDIDAERGNAAQTTGER